MKSSTVIASALALVSPFFACADDESYITCGSAIKISHTENGKSYYLDSGPHKINAGSNQQLVTAVDERNNMSSLWLVAEANGDQPCHSGVTKIPYGAKIRLTNLETGANLHSHNFQSPISRQQEVTGFGDNGQGDSGDDWVVQPTKSTSEKYWVRGEPVRLV